MDIIEGISNLICNFDPLTPPTYASECLHVFKNMWTILDSKDRIELFLKSQYVEDMTLKFCQYINLFFIPKKSVSITTLISMLYVSCSI